MNFRIISSKNNLLIYPVKKITNLFIKKIKYLKITYQYYLYIVFNIYSLRSTINNQTYHFTQIKKKYKIKRKYYFYYIIFYYGLKMVKVLIIKE